MKFSARRTRLIGIVSVIGLFVGIAAFRGLVSEANPAPPVLPPGITATQTVTLAVDADSDGKADPGDTLQYTTTITNSGTDATGVVLTDDLTAATRPLTVVGGTLNIAPIAANDTYNTIGNVNIVVPTGAGSLLSNDVDPDGGTLTITGFGNTLPTANANAPGATVASTNNGSLTVNANGSFNYDPPVSGIATETFFYTVSDGTGGTDTAQVTINLAGKIWFINNTAGACPAAPCDGRLSHPFVSTTTFQTANAGGAGQPAAGDFIFIHTGTATYNGSITPLNNQKFIGQGASQTILAITGFTAPSGTSQLPGTGTNPVLGTAAGNLFTVGVGISPTLRGFTIGNTAGIDIVSGVSFGTLTVSEVTINGSGRPMSLTSGALAATFVSITSTAAAGGQGINLAGITGSLTSGSTSITNPATQCILIGTTTAAVSLGNTTCSGGTDGISLQNNSSGTRTFGTLNVSGGSGNAFLSGAGGGNATITGVATLSSTLDAVSINAPGATNVINFQAATSATRTSAGGNGVSWVGTAGATLTFSALTVQTSGGTGLNATTGGTVTVTNNTGTINNTTQAAPAIVANAVALNANFASINSSGGANGVTLTNVTGTSNFGGGALSGASGGTFLVNGSTETVTFNGTITQAAAGQRVIDIQNKTGGTVTFGGAISSTGGTGTGIILNSNTGATINFTGGIALTTNANAAFTATGGGTVSATQNNGTIVNTLTTTTATALNVANTTIGASGLTFRSINSSTASGNAGIVLNTTGNSGGLVVTGNASAGTGGTISSKTVDAVSLTSTSNVSLSFMNVNSNSHKGIVGTGVNGFTLISSTLSGNGTTDATNDNGLRLIDTTGAVTLTSDTVTGSFATNAWISTTPSSTAAITTLTVTNGSFNSSNQGDGFLISLSNTASIATGSITGSTFASNASMALNPVANDNTTMGNGVGAPATGTLTISNNTFTNNGGLGVSFASGGGNGASTQYVRFVGNVMTGTKSFAINVVSGATSTGGTQKVLIDNNCIGMSGAVTGTAAGHCGVTPGPADSGSKLGEGIQVTQQGKTLGTVTITNNFIRNLSNGVGEFGNRVVDVQTLGPAPAQGAIPIPFDVRIVGNNLDSGFTGSFPQAAIYLGVDDQSGTPTTMHAEIHGNTVPAVAGCEGNSCTASTGMIFYDLVTAPSTGTLFNFSGSGASVSSEIANTNTGTSGKTCAVSGSLSLTGTAPSTVARHSVPSNFNDFYAGIQGSGTTETPDGFGNNLSFLNTPYQSPLSGYKWSLSDEQLPLSGEQLSLSDEQLSLSGEQSSLRSEQLPLSGEQSSLSDEQLPLFAETIALFTYSRTAAADFTGRIADMISPTVYAQKDGPPKVAIPNSPQTGTVTTSPAFTLPAGKSVTITFKTTVNNGPYSAGLDNITNNAVISGSNFGSVTSTTSSIALDAAPDLSVTASDGAVTTQPGAVQVYTLTYKNANPINGQDATGVTLSNTVPANTTFNSASSSAGWSCANNAPAGSVCTNTIGALSANNTTATKNFAVNVFGALPAGVIQVSDTSTIAEVPANTNGTDLNPADNTGTDNTPIIGNWLGGTSTDWFTASNWSNNTVPPSGNNVSIPSSANVPTITGADVTLNNLTLNGQNMFIQTGRTVNVTGTAALGVNSTDGAGTLDIGSTGVITRTTGQVNSTLSKTFVATGPFTYPVGTSGAFSPVDVNVTAGTGTLSVRANTGTAPAVPSLNSATTLQRFWALNGSGITADVTWHYLQTDVVGLEANYRTIVVSGTNANLLGNVPPCPGAGPVCVDPTANTITVRNMTTFSLWTAGELAPVAANASVSGRVLDQNGRGAAFVRVALSDQSGNTMYAVTNPFGYFRFVDVPVGRSYSVSIVSKHATYAPRIVTINEDLAGLDFTPQ